MIATTRSRFLQRLSALAVIILVGCQPETSVEKTTPSAQPLQVLTFPQLPASIQQQALWVSGILQKKALFFRNERGFGIVVNGRIHRVERADGRVSYTLPLERLGKGLYYDNLVIQQLPDGTTSETLIRYEPDWEWWSGSKGVYNYASYSGLVSFFTATGEPLASVQLQDGKPMVAKSAPTSTAQRIELSCYITDVQYAGLEQDGVFYVTDIMYWFECEVYEDGNTNPDGGGSYDPGGGGASVGSAPTGEPEYAEDGGGTAGNGDTQDEEEEDKLIIDPSVPPCVQAIIAALMEKANLSLIPDITNDPGVSHLSQIILNLFSASQQYNLTIRVAPIVGNQINAITGIPTAPNPITGQFNILTTLDDEYVANATTLAIARTVIHESLHALLAYLYQTDSDTPFMQLLQNYRNDYGNGLGEHEFMTQFAEAIGHSLAIWDNHRLPQAYYNNLAWSGDMTQVPAFLALPPEQQQAIRDANIAEGQANAPATGDAQGTPCNPE